MSTTRRIGIGARGEIAFGEETEVRGTYTFPAGGGLDTGSVTYTANFVGADGNLINVTHTNSAGPAGVTVTVAGNAINVIFLASTDTAALICTAVNADPKARKLVVATEAAAGPQIAATIQFLVGGRAYGDIIVPTKAIDFVSETLNNEIGSLVSNAITPNRGIRKRVRGNFQIGGDIAFEQNTEGYDVIYKHALGTNCITIPAADGGIRAQLSDGEISTAVTIRCRSIPTSFPATGDFVVVTKAAATGLLTAVIDEYTAVDYDAATFTVGAPGSGTAYAKGDWLFLHDTPALDTVFTHYLPASDTLPVGISIEMGRDIAFFYYTGMRVNTLEETFNSGDMCTGTFSYLGRSEISGGDLTTAVVAGAPTIAVSNSDMSEFNAAGGTIAIGSENDITYTGITLLTLTGIPAAGLAGSIFYNHEAGEPVAVQSTLAATTLVPPTTDPLSSFQAALYVEGVAQEAQNVSYTVNNNLFADKFQIGDRFRVAAPEQRREVTGTFTVEFDNMILYRKYINGTSAMLEIRCVDDSIEGEIGTTDVYRQKHIIFQKVEFTGETPKIGGPDMILENAPFQAFEDTDYDKPEILIILVNSVNNAFVAS